MLSTILEILIYRKLFKNNNVFFVAIFLYFFIGLCFLPREMELVTHKEIIPKINKNALPGDRYNGEYYPKIPVYVGDRVAKASIISTNYRLYRHKWLDCAYGFITDHSLRIKKIVRADDRCGE